jgi:DNA-binding XRE family transcriptional regulator
MVLALPHPHTTARSRHFPAITVWWADRATGPAPAPRFDGARLTAARKALHLSQRDLAHAAGIPLTTVRNWEQGRATPGAERLAALALALGLAAGDLLTESGE